MKILVILFIIGLCLTTVRLYASLQFEEPKDDSKVSVYFGSGCFWGRQKDFVDAEQGQLSRHIEEVSALVGYAGGKPGLAERSCYYGSPAKWVYENQGHAEVTQVDLRGLQPEINAQMALFSTTFFDQFEDTGHGMGRLDPQDRGLGYRSLVGLPGGTSGELFSIFKSKNKHNMRLVSGSGSEEEVFNTVFVMDSLRFPFHQAEMYHQFHSDMGHNFPLEYTHDLRSTLFENGRVKPTGCPELH
eukprot:CAMPEP_0196584968 /NCGR_PEP_ID=MMETSP1081-20130531/49174_1 /TAXON_ID=36882 /ORGANISM="Pyramimonas amylifera, Strain CCMP720" /LENGTH=243 /DNA_ID=CAMNT_0041906363 /DNA_START=52 /DNA_END=783 /DNA_ORIENTATION=+